MQRWGLGFLVLLGGCTLHSEPEEPDSAIPDGAISDQGPLTIDVGRVDVAGDTCALELPCGSPAGPGGDEICVSGRIVDGADSTHFISTPVEIGEIELRVYEPLNFFADPTIAPFRTLLLSQGIDGCGRFVTRFSTSQDTPNGLVAFVVTGRVGSATANSFVMGTSTARPQANVNLVGMLGFMVSKGQDATWAAQAGFVATGTFASRGTLAVRYHTPPGAPFALFRGEPIANVLPQFNNVTDPSKDFFFVDSARMTLSQARSTTGPNGTALLTLGKGLGNVNAVSGTPGTCSKPSGAAGTLTIVGPTLIGTVEGAIVFFDLEASCN